MKPGVHSVTSYTMHRQKIETNTLAGLCLHPAYEDVEVSNNMRILNRCAFASGFMPTICTRAVPFTPLFGSSTICSLIEDCMTSFQDCLNAPVKFFSLVKTRILWRGRFQLDNHDHYIATRPPGHQLSHIRIEIPYTSSDDLTLHPDWLVMVTMHQHTIRISSYG